VFFKKEDIALASALINACGFYCFILELCLTKDISWIVHAFYFYILVLVS
jgi:hypothetical protein